MSNKYQWFEKEIENLRSCTPNIAKVHNSGNSTNNININTDSNARVFSSTEEQGEEGEDIF